MKKKFSVSKTEQGVLMITHDDGKELISNLKTTLYWLFKDLQPGDKPLTFEFDMPEPEVDISYQNVYLIGDTTYRYRTLEDAERLRLKSALATYKTTIIGDDVTVEKVWSKDK